MRIAFLTPETAPYAKTGGLADVAAALPPALAAAGLQVMLFMPAYSGGQGSFPEGKTVDIFDLEICGRVLETRLIKKKIRSGLDHHFIVQDLLFCRRFLYGQGGVDYFDNLARFFFLQKAVLTFLLRRGIKVDLLHLNDWQTALVPALLRLEPFSSLPGPPATLLTLHNLAYQGLFPWSEYRVLGLPSGAELESAAEFHGRLSCLKSGIVLADGLNTVSPTYAAEILGTEMGCGLDGVLASQAGKLSGILNGAEYRVWNPARDRHLSSTFSRSSLGRKQANKKFLFQRWQLALDPATPLAVFIGRLDRQKGIELLLEAWPMLRREKLVIAVLGTGEQRLERELNRLAERHPERFVFLNIFSEEAAHQLNAAADLLLMPSVYEPCGLNQIYAMKYGVLPLVHRTGGLRDTVVEVDLRTLSGTGFTFRNMDARDLLAALKKALALYAEPRKWRRIQLNAMAQDFSWSRSAAEYIALYKKINRRK